MLTLAECPSVRLKSVSRMLLPLFFRPRSTLSFKLWCDKLINLNRKFGSSLGCGSEVTLGCFCGKPNPLQCAWV